ncbi:hypothetical protein, partial [Serratia marcescens]|uniref:hypothetical protein n=1 Tax=Serratia marcescens TaxID=615 RepID=UPI003FA78E31
TPKAAEKITQKIIILRGKARSAGGLGVARVRVLFMLYCINIQFGYDYAEQFKVVCFFTR